MWGYAATFQRLDTGNHSELIGQPSITPPTPSMPVFLFFLMSYENGCLLYALRSKLSSFLKVLSLLLSGLSGTRHIPLRRKYDGNL